MTQDEKYMLEFDVNRLTAENLHLKKELSFSQQDRDYILESVYHNTQEIKALSDNETLAQDTIRIALNIAGYDIENMNQFERASAILNVATEHKAMMHEKDIWKVLYTRTWEKTMRE